jgi:hypothetical protein
LLGLVVNRLVSTHQDVLDACGFRPSTRCCTNAFDLGLVVVYLGLGRFDAFGIVVLIVVRLCTPLLERFNPLFFSLNQISQRGHACHIGLLDQTGLDKLDRLGLLRYGSKRLLLKLCVLPLLKIIE